MSGDTSYYLRGFSGSLLVHMSPLFAARPGMHLTAVVSTKCWKRRHSHRHQRRRRHRLRFTRSFSLSLPPRKTRINKESACCSWWQLFSFDDDHHRLCREMTRNPRWLDGTDLKFRQYTTLFFILYYYYYFFFRGVEKYYKKNFSKKYVSFSLLFFVLTNSLLLFLSLLLKDMYVTPVPSSGSANIRLYLQRKKSLPLLLFIQARKGRKNIFITAYSPLLRLDFAKIRLKDIFMSSSKLHPAHFSFFFTK